MFTKAISILVALLTIIVSNVEGQEVSVQMFPSTVGGYKVLTIQDSLACMPPGRTRIVLQANQPDVTTFLNEVNRTIIKDEINTLVDNWDLTVVGPDVTLNEILKRTNERELWYEDSACPQLKPTIDIEPGGTEVVVGGEGAGLALFENTNAGLYIDDNAQAVRMKTTTDYFKESPRFQDNYSAILNNVATNTGFFLQAGIFYHKQPEQIYVRPPELVWSTSFQNFEAQAFDLQYWTGHTFWFTVTYTNGLWWMCVADLDRQHGTAYVCEDEAAATGTHLGASLDTSIWFENVNFANDLDWYQGFTPPTISHAKIYRNGIEQYWSAEHKHIVHHCNSGSWPVSNVLTGSLVNGGTGTFTLSGVPPWCI